MNINTLMDDLSAAVAQDSALAAWVAATYGGSFKVFVSKDERNPPQVTDFPSVVLYPFGKTIGRGITTKGHDIAAECWIDDESLRDRGIANIVEYNGVQRIEEMRKLVETAIAAVDTGNVLLDRVEAEYETIAMFPIFFSGMVVTFTEDTPMGADRLL